MTNGASHGLDLMLARFTSPGDTVVVEAPTYFFGLDVLRDRRVRLLPVPVTAIPAFQNPTGVIMSSGHRERLAELAAPHLAATLHSLLNQQDVDPGRVVIITVDNNSADGSDTIARQAAAANHNGMKVVNLQLLGAAADSHHRRLRRHAVPHL